MKYPSIPAFYRGRSVLITGATGFMGKVMVEKLLRCCPDLDTLYLLVRPKKGVDPKKRKEVFTSSQAFSRLRAERPGFEDQLCVVSGDVSLDDLGLGAEEAALLRAKVSVVLHCAATVRFDQPLATTVGLNTLGTTRALKLAETMPLLEAFVYVSTAFCHCDQEVLEEKVYPSKVDPEKIVDMVSWMDAEMLDLLTPKLIGGLPNTYAYSKNLSEQVAANFAKRIPVAIARPSIVTSSYKEPMAGWVDNINGPIGLTIAAAKGVVRSFHCRPDYHGDTVPVDMTTNAIIALAWQLANHRESSPLVCNVTANMDNPLKWGEVLEAGKVLPQFEFPLEDGVWFPDGSIKSSFLLHSLCVLLFHFVPAYLIDFLMLLCGQKLFMVNLQKRINGGLKMLQYYTTREWDFRNDNLHALRDAMTPEDRETFYFDIRVIDWAAYIRDVWIGAKVFYLKEDMSNLPRARKRMRRLYWLHQVTCLVIYCLIGWLLYSWLGAFLTCLDWASTTFLSVFHNAPILRVMAEEMT